MKYKIEKVQRVQKIEVTKSDEINLKYDNAYADEFISYLDQKYKYQESTTTPLKNSVSVILNEFNKSNDYIKEDFLTEPMYQNAMIESTQVGIAYHSAMQEYSVNISEEEFMNRIKNALDAEDIKLVDLSKVLKAKNNLDSIIQNKKVRLFKEQKFMMYVPYNKIFKTSYVEDEILVQGIIDLIIEFEDKIILIDYKTNKTKNIENFKNNYSTQLWLYKMALELNFKKNVEPYIYAFSLNTFINME